MADLFLRWSEASWERNAARRRGIDIPTVISEVAALGGGSGRCCLARLRGGLVARCGATYVEVDEAIDRACAQGCLVVEHDAGATWARVPLHGGGRRWRFTSGGRRVTVDGRGTMPLPVALDGLGCRGIGWVTAPLATGAGVARAFERGLEDGMDGEVATMGSASERLVLAREALAAAEASVATLRDDVLRLEREAVEERLAPLRVAAGELRRAVEGWGCRLIVRRRGDDRLRAGPPTYGLHVADDGGRSCDCDVDVELM